jgi:phenylacetate-CoA ligase
MKSKLKFDPYLRKSANSILSQLSERDASFWESERSKVSLRLFHAAAERVPAYKNFLKKNKVNPLLVKSFKDFIQVPSTDKKNYVNAYPLHELSWDGKIDRLSIFTSTSGSTGNQTYFYRSEILDWQYSVIQEFFFRNSVSINKPTLVIICFGMGIWIGGLLTYESMATLAKRGYPISIATPGINKSEIFKILKKLSPQFAQTVIIGYPPFVKDIIDEAPDHDIKLSKLNIRIITAAEAYSEDFRDYLAKAVKIKNPVLDIMSIYGSADIGAMSFETPSALAIKRLCRSKMQVFDTLFNSIDKTPTLTQFIPSFINFESPNDELLLTGNSAMPLIRYAIGDRGGVYSYQQMNDKLALHGETIPKIDGDSSGKMQLPYVYVFERNDFSTTLYGLQVYPETIREVLIKTPFAKILTGKFTLVTRFSSKQDQYLEINLELGMAKNISKIAELQLQNAVVKNLLKKNSEYRELHKFIGDRSAPKLVFWPAEDPKYFRPGVKQSWINKA